jgi:ubiquinone biosynthesis protein UbiJ
MNPLETLLRPFAALLNRQIRLQTPARELCADLDGRVFAIRVRDTALAMYVLATAGEIVLATEYPDDPDVVVSGSLLSLARLAGGDGEAVIRDGAIDLSGDADSAQKFQRLFRFARPDLEEELSGTVGDVIAHAVGDAARGVLRWGREARTTMRQNVGEYLQEESRAVPSRYEVDTFRRDVETLRDDVARIEARLDRIAALKDG